MDQNPYAPPRRDVLLQSSAADFREGEPRPWDIGDVISESWAVFKQYWPVVLGAVVIMYAIVFAVQFCMGALLGGGMGARTFGERGNPFGIAFFATLIVQQIAGAFFQVGLCRIILAAVRGQSPQFGLLFSGGDRFIVAFLSMLLFIIAMYAGFILLIIPGFIVLAGFANTTWFAADSELGVIECLKTSWQTMSGHKMKYVGLALVLGLLNIAGAIPCGLGLVVTAPMSFIAMAIVFIRVTGRGGVAPVTAQPAY